MSNFKNHSFSLFIFIVDLILSYFLNGRHTLVKERGIDGAKKVKAQKRYIVTETQKHILQVTVHAANTHDTVSGCKVFEKAVKKYPSVLGVCADAEYRKTMEFFVVDVLKKLLQFQNE